MKAILLLTILSTLIFAKMPTAEYLCMIDNGKIMIPVATTATTLTLVLPSGKSLSFKWNGTAYVNMPIVILPKGLTLELTTIDKLTNQPLYAPTIINCSPVN